MNQRIIVLSDTHGSLRALKEIVLHYEKEAACFLHCGDGEREVYALKEQMPKLALHMVRGNCDRSSELPSVQQVEVGGRSIYFTHGHLQQVKFSLVPLQQAARNAGAEIVLYGHTHCAYVGYEDGLHIMNPGSPVQSREGSASFGVIDVGAMGIVCNLVHYNGIWR